MAIFNEIFDQIFKQAIADGVPPEDLAEMSGEITADLIEQIASEMRRDLKRKAPSQLRRTRRDTVGFEKRNLQRWRKPFNLIELMIEIATELGQKFNEEIRPEAVLEQDAKFEALVSIHARSLLAANECVCLMKGGYADGALTRWRTLHELNVVAAFLLKNDAKVAARYIVSFELQALSAAKQMKTYADRSNMDPPSDVEIAAMEARCKHLTDRFGEGLDSDFGWASKVLGKKKPNLFDIEVATGLDHWRPRFKWACQHTHGAHRPFGSMLGTTESEEPVLLVGQSNSGMVDPLHMTAISLTHVTTSLLLSRPDPDRVISAKVLMALSEDVGAAALKVEHVKPAHLREVAH